MKKILILLVGLFLLSGCAGPAYPEKDGRQYLKQRGYSSKQIDAVVNGWKLERSLVYKLINSKSSDVRFLVARNPNLTKEQINLFMKDKDDFARSGVACNTNLSPAQIEILTFDPSHTVYCKLAANESLSKSALLRIHKERKPGLLWFAQNPNCPDAIRKEILGSGDSLTKQWLGIIDNWKKNGTYVKGEDGRWRKPVKQLKAKAKIQTQTQNNVSVTLKGMLCNDFSPNKLLISHPSPCANIEGYWRSGGSEIIFVKQSTPKQWVHAVFPKSLAVPKNLKKQINLQGYFQRIKVKESKKLRKRINNYKYFVVTSWEYQK